MPCKSERRRPQVVDFRILPGELEDHFHIYIFCSRLGRRAGVYSLAPAGFPATLPAICGDLELSPSARFPGSKMVTEIPPNWTKWHHLLMWKEGYGIGKYLGTLFQILLSQMAQVRSSPPHVLTQHMSQEVEERTRNMSSSIDCGKWVCPLPRWPL